MLQLTHVTFVLCQITIHFEVHNAIVHRAPVLLNFLGDSCHLMVSLNVGDTDCVFYSTKNNAYHPRTLNVPTDILVLKYVANSMRNRVIRNEKIIPSASTARLGAGNLILSR